MTSGQLYRLNISINLMLYPLLFLSCTHRSTQLITAPLSVILAIMLEFLIWSLIMAAHCSTRHPHLASGLASHTKESKVMAIRKQVNLSPKLGIVHSFHDSKESNSFQVVWTRANEH